MYECNMLRSVMVKSDLTYILHYYYHQVAPVEEPDPDADLKPGKMRIILLVILLLYIT